MHAASAVETASAAADVTGFLVHFSLLEETIVETALEKYGERVDATTLQSTMLQRALLDVMVLQTHASRSFVQVYFPLPTSDAL